MIWVYLATALLIAWGVARDFARRETWMIGIGKLVRSEKPGLYWLTMALRCFVLLAVVIVTWFRFSV